MTKQQQQEPLNFWCCAAIVIVPLTPVVLLCWAASGRPRMTDEERRLNEHIRQVDADVTRAIEYVRTGNRSAVPDRRMRRNLDALTEHFRENREREAAERVAEVKTAERVTERWLKEHREQAAEMKRSEERIAELREKLARVGEMRADPQPGDLDEMGGMLDRLEEIGQEQERAADKLREGARRNPFFDQ